MSLQGKFKKLKKRLSSLGSVLVAYSGGLDSTLLLKAAKDALKDKVLAVTASSETYPAGELAFARGVARRLKARHKTIKTSELKDSRFRSNPENRCYFCKKELFAKLKRLALRYKLNFVIDGSNFDDTLDYRPGAKAKEEFGVISPLEEAGLTKGEIRDLSKKFRLATSLKPAMPCLASRVPYNSPISKQRLERIDKAEQIIRKSFSVKGNLRVRDFADAEARVEVDKDEIKKLALSKRLKILLEGLGYKNIVVDLRGYRMGSLNKEIARK